MHKELELWNAIEIIYEILALNNAPLATKCGGDFKEYECKDLNPDGLRCEQYDQCLASKKTYELSCILDDNKVHIDCLEAERQLKETGKCCG